MAGKIHLVLLSLLHVVLVMRLSCEGTNCRHDRDWGLSSLNTSKALFSTKHRPPRWCPMDFDSRSLQKRTENVSS